MRITRQLEDLRLDTRPVVLAVGYFDGVHRGHQAVIGEAVSKAAAMRGEAWVLTLDPHPLKILKPQAAPPLITSTPHKIALMEPLGVDGCVVLPFTRELAAEEPEDFVARLHRAAPNLKELVVGQNWTFGHKGRGTADLLRKLAPDNDLQVSVVEPLLWKKDVISSTRIRRSVAKGDLEDAEQMLGRPFSVLGTVVRGRHIGTQLGFPTANLDPHNEVRPPSGVYAVYAKVHGRQWPGAAFIADITDAKGSPSGFIVEVHILGFDMDVYGEDIEVSFVRHVRDVQHFNGREALRQQIARDVQAVGDMLPPVD